MFFQPPVCLSVNLCVYLFVCPSVCGSVNEDYRNQAMQVPLVHALEGQTSTVVNTKKIGRKLFD